MKFVKPGFDRFQGSPEPGFNRFLPVYLLKKKEGLILNNSKLR